MADDAFSSDSEEWRDIPGWDGYQASSLGRIRSLDRKRVQWMRDGSMQPVLYPGRIRKQSQCPQTGYMKVGLSNLQSGKRRTFCAHQLVCLAFHGERPARHDTAHENGNRSDNRASNLRWATRQENRLDSVQHGTINRGERNGQARLSDADVMEMRRLRHSGVTARELATRYGVTARHVYDCLAGRRRGKHGRRFKE